MRNIFNFSWVIAALWFCCGVGKARDREAWQTLQPALSKMLNDAATRIEKMEGPDAERARYDLVTALAKSGDYPAARKIAVRLNNTGYAVNAWSTIGHIQGMIAHDRTAANSDFEQAVEAAQRLKAGSSSLREPYAEIATARASSGDIKGALSFVLALDKQAKPEALLRLARYAARRGNEAPALALLQSVTYQTELSEAHSLRAIALAERDGDTPAAREALAKVTEPLHKIPVLLALFDNPLNGAGSDVRLLDEALAAVAQNKPLPGSFGFQDVGNDAALGAVALRQLKLKTGKAEAIKQADATLQKITSLDNAQKYVEQFCEKIAISDLTTALSISQRVDGKQRIGVLCAIARGLGRQLSSQPKEQHLKTTKTIEKLINQALDIANTLKDWERRWAGVPVVHALAEAGEFPAAHQVANGIDVAGNRAYAFAGIARSAIENRHEAQAREALKNMENAALTEKQPEVAAQIIAQATLEITEPLLGEESYDLASGLAGLG